MMKLGKKTSKRCRRKRLGINKKGSGERVMNEKDGKGNECNSGGKGRQRRRWVLYINCYQKERNRTVLCYFCLPLGKEKLALKVKPSAYARWSSVPKAMMFVSWRGHDKGGESFILVTRL